MIDASSGTHPWAGHMDGAMEGMFGLQAVVASRLVGAIGPALEVADFARPERRVGDLQPWQRAADWHSGCCTARAGAAACL